MVEAIWRAQLFKMMMGIRSGLVASFTLMLLNKVSIASMIMKQVYETVNMFIIKSGQSCKITPLSTSNYANVYLSGLQPLQPGNFVHHCFILRGQWKIHLLTSSPASFELDFVI